MQLSANGGVPLATAQVSNMAGFGGGGGFNDVFGVSYGNGVYTFRNDTLNDVFLATDFGGVLSFDLTFAGEHDPLTSYVSHFLVSAFDEGDAPLGAYDPVTFALADFSWTPALTAGAEGGIGQVVPTIIFLPAWLLAGLPGNIAIEITFVRIISTLII